MSPATTVKHAADNISCFKISETIKGVMAIRTDVRMLGTVMIFDRELEECLRIRLELVRVYGYLYAVKYTSKVCKLTRNLNRHRELARTTAHIHKAKYKQRAPV